MIVVLRDLINGTLLADFNWRNAVPPWVVNAVDKIVESFRIANTWIQANWPIFRDTILQSFNDIKTFISIY